MDLQAYTFPSDFINFLKNRLSFDPLHRSWASAPQASFRQSFLRAALAALQKSFDVFAAVTNPATRIVDKLNQRLPPLPPVPHGLHADAQQFRGLLLGK